MFDIFFYDFWWLGLLFRKTVTDSNAPVQEKALDALIAFLKAAYADGGRYWFHNWNSKDQYYLLWGFEIELWSFIWNFVVHRYAKEVCDSIVAKCLTGWPNTVEKAQVAFLSWIWGNGCFLGKRPLAIFLLFSNLKCQLFTHHLKLDDEGLFDFMNKYIG